MKLKPTLFSGFFVGKNLKHETQGAAREMNKLKMAIANLGLSIAIPSDPFARPITDGFSQGYSYPTPTKRITGHAKINRAGKKRRNKK